MSFLFYIVIVTPELLAIKSLYYYYYYYYYLRSFYYKYLHICANSLVVNALRYKPACRGFNSRWCRWNFSVT